MHKQNIISTRLPDSKTIAIPAKKSKPCFEIEKKKCQLLRIFCKSSIFATNIGQPFSPTLTADGGSISMLSLCDAQLGNNP